MNIATPRDVSSATAFLAFLTGLALVLGATMAEGGLAAFTGQVSVAGNTFTTVTNFPYYLHNDPTPPTADTTAQSPLLFDRSAPTATTLYNYGTNYDSSAGRTVNVGGLGATETDLAKYQAWRTAGLASGLTINGTVDVTLWSATKDFELVGGSVTIYLRHYDGSSYTEICNGTLTDATDWQGGSSTWVVNTISFSCSSYTIPAGDFFEVKLIVTDASAADLWIAYDTTSYYSRVVLP